VRDPGPVFDDVVYTGYPRFNYHPRLARDLLDSGFDYVSTANNHALDRGPAGADHTGGVLRATGLPFSGTVTGAETIEWNPDAVPWERVVERGGFRLAFIACTLHTNGIPDPYGQVLGCYRDRSVVLARIRAAASDPRIDAVIATPHWGDTEYVEEPDARQLRLAREMVDAGALAVLGSHPHVVRRVEKITRADGREAFVIYSLGNFVSGQLGFNRRGSVLLYVGLTRLRTGETVINGVRHLPIYVARGSEGIQARPAMGAYDAYRPYVERVLAGSLETRPDAPVVTSPGCR
jgi:poly-gamma-glutamate synthesis protein (capsule biosynthesis protein)